MLKRPVVKQCFEAVTFVLFDIVISIDIILKSCRDAYVIMLKAEAPN